MTGLVDGAVPNENEIAINLERMRNLVEFDAASATMTVEAGAVLADIRSAAEDVDRMFPLLLGAQGSCQIGGNLSTNAGGINVVRYGKRPK